MKKLILLVLIAYIYVGCQAQESGTAWLPKSYVDAMLLKDSLASKYLYPIEGFESHNEVLYILTYKGELNPVKIKTTYDAGKEKDQLLDIQYYLNMKYVPKEEVQRLSKANIYLSYLDDKFMVEIIENEKCDTIYFVNKIFNQKFITIREAKEKITFKAQISNQETDIDLSGSWAFLDEKDCYCEAYIDEANIVFLLDLVEKTGPFSYIIKNDSLYFSGYKYKIDFKNCDSLILLSNYENLLLFRINIGKSQDTSSYDPVYLRRCNFLVNNSIISMDEAIEYLNSLQINGTIKEVEILKNE